MGVFFSAGWSPCLGYVLGPILTIAGFESPVSKGVILLTAYSTGLAIPFLIATTQISLVTTVIRRYGKVMHYVEIAMGVVMIVVGILLLLGKYALIANLGASFSPAFDEVIVGRYLLFALIAAALIGLLPAYIAKQKGRDFYNWWFFGASLFIIALLLALKLKPTGLQPDQVSDRKVSS
jgi:thiol:disulfide interchange protein